MRFEYIRLLTHAYELSTIQPVVEQSNLAVQNFSMGVFQNSGAGLETDPQLLGCLFTGNLCVILRKVMLSNHVLY